MFKNNLPISRIIGIGLLGVSLLPLVLFVNMAETIINGGYYDNKWTVVLAVVFLVFFISGVGCILALRWMRNLLTIIIVIATLIVLYLFLSSRTGFSSYVEITFVVGVSCFFLSIATTLLLLLHNRKLDEEFGSNNIDIDEYDKDILDV